MNYLIREAKTEDTQEMLCILDPLIQEAKHTILLRSYSLEKQTEFIPNFLT